MFNASKNFHKEDLGSNNGIELEASIWLATAELDKRYVNSLGRRSRLTAKTWMQPIALALLFLVDTWIERKFQKRNLDFLLHPTANFLSRISNSSSVTLCKPLG